MFWLIPGLITSGPHYLTLEETHCKRIHLQSILPWHLLESQIKFFICLESKAVNETSLCSTMHADRRKLKLTKLSQNNVPSFVIVYVTAQFTSITVNIIRQ